MGTKCVRDVENIVEGKLPERAVQTHSKYLSKEVGNAC